MSARGGQAQSGEQGGDSDVVATDVAPASVPVNARALLYAGPSAPATGAGARAGPAAATKLTTRWPVTSVPSVRAAMTARGRGADEAGGGFRDDLAGGGLDLQRAVVGGELFGAGLARRDQGE